MTLPIYDGLSAQQRYSRKHKRLGLCHNCTKKAVPGLTKCASCKRAANRASRAHQKQVRSERRTAGLCTMCGGAPLAGKVTCGPCRKKRHDRYKAAL
jgi:hypothetical protein